MPSLFSMPTPEAVRANARQRLFQTAAQTAQAPRGRGFVQAASQAGGLFGEAIGRGLGGQAPGEAEAMKFQNVQAQIQEKFADTDLSLPENQIKMMGESAQLLGQAGFQDQAAQAMQMANEIRTSIAKGAKSTSAKQKMDELIAQGIDPETAQGIAFGTFKTMVDPTTGDVITVDTRKVGKGGDADASQEVRKGTKQVDKFNKRVTDYATKIEKSKIIPQESALREVEEIFADVLGSDDPDLPSIGRTALLPDFMLSAQGKDLRQRIQTLFNMTLKDRSGAAVTVPEFERLKKEFGAGAFKTDAQMVSAVQRFRRALDSHKASLAAGESDDIVKEYQDRGGIKIKTFARKLVYNPKTGKVEPK